MQWTDRKLRQAQELEAMRTEMARINAMEPEEAAEYLGKRCEHCDRLLVPRVEQVRLPWIEGTKRVFVWPKLCGCEAEGQALRQRAERDFDEQQSEILKRAGLEGWLTEATFATFKERAEWPPALQARETCKAFAEAARQGTLGARSFLVLYGDYGMGKTHLSASIVLYMLDAGWRDVRLVSWSRWAESVQESWKKGGTDELHRGLREARLVAIDDIDKRRPTPWTREVLYPIIDHRYKRHLPTVFSFNYAIDDVDPTEPGRLALEVYLGRAVLDRILGATYKTPIEFKGASYRSKLQFSLPLNDGENEHEPLWYTQ